MSGRGVQAPPWSTRAHARARAVAPAPTPLERSAGTKERPNRGAPFEEHTLASPQMRLYPGEIYEELLRAALILVAWRPASTLWDWAASGALPSKALLRAQPEKLARLPEVQKKCGVVVFAAMHAHGVART